MKAVADASQNMPALAGGGAKAALQQAQTIYDQRAAAEAAKQGISADQARSEIEKRLEAALDDPAPALQRAIGCLRQLATPAA
jgi:hypothetical protein